MIAPYACVTVKERPELEGNPTAQRHDCRRCGEQLWANPGALKASASAAKQMGMEIYVCCHPCAAEVIGEFRDENGQPADELVVVCPPMDQETPS